MRRRKNLKISIKNYIDFEKSNAKQYFSKFESNRGFKNPFKITHFPLSVIRSEITL